MAASKIDSTVACTASLDAGSPSTRVRRLNSIHDRFAIEASCWASACSCRGHEAASHLDERLGAQARTNLRYTIGMAGDPTSYQCCGDVFDSFDLESSLGLTKRRRFEYPQSGVLCNQHRALITISLMVLWAFSRLTRAQNRIVGLEMSTE